MKRIKTYKVFESKESVESICNKYGIRNWTLNSDGTVDVDGDVYLNGKELTELPLKFGKVTGYFDCSWNNLISLEGSPNWVGDSFVCSFNKLINLVGSPNWVGGNFACRVNNLTSLEGCPEKIYEDLNCQHNNIHSLEYYPTILTGKLCTDGNPVYEIWKNVWYHKPNNHGVLLELFWLNNPVRFEGGQWVCNRECLDNFFEEIGVPSPPKLKNYKDGVKY